MIEFSGVSLGYSPDSPVLRDCSCIIPSDRKFIVYADAGEGKTTLLQGLAGLLAPSTGDICRYANLSFPVGYTGGFRNELTVEENIRLAAESYETDADTLVAYVASFPGLDSLLGLGCRGLLPGMQARLSYAIAFGLPFDCFLIDGPPVVGDQLFRAACMDAFKERCRSYIMTTRHILQLTVHADCGAILKDGELEVFDEVEPMVREARLRSAKLPRAI